MIPRTLLASVAAATLAGTGGGGLPPLPGAHRHWRIHITANAGGDLSALTQVQMYEIPFAENAIGGGTVSADSEFSGTYPDDNAVDHLLQDGSDSASNEKLWASANTSPPHWIAYDFGMGNDIEILSVGLHMRRSDQSAQYPAAFSVQYSDDGSVWTTSWSESGLSLSAFEYHRSNHPAATVPGGSGSKHGSHAHWRLFLMNPGDTAVSVAEAQFRATPGGADQATGGTASASSTFSGFPASNAFDNDTGTLWNNSASGANRRWAWLRYQFAAPVEVAEVALTMRNDGFIATAPQHFAVQYSDDGTVWTTAWMVLGETGWSLGETRVYTDPDYVAP